MTPTGRDRSYVLPFGFAMTVSMWAVAYLCRLPAVLAPSWLLLALMLATVGLWGWVTGVRTGGGWRAGVLVGATAAVLNMLILGSLLASAEGGGVVPSALWWVPGSILVVALVSGGFAAVAGSSLDVTSDSGEWTGLFSKVALAATFLLVVAGGLVTSSEAGLAVVDWPNTFGYNLFLYPLARMTGGIFYEHAHRLFGALVGLTAIALAIRLWRYDDRPWLKRLSIVAVVMVVLQGMLGGLRVTGGFTLSTSEADMAPSLTLALIHGVLGQIFLGVMVAIAVVTSALWFKAPAPETRPHAKDDRTFQRWLIAIMIVQLVLGAAQRHLVSGFLARRASRESADLGDLCPGLPWHRGSCRDHGSRDGRFADNPGGHHHHRPSGDRCGSPRPQRDPHVVDPAAFSTGITRRLTEAVVDL
jgi:hypothetical protein